MKSARLFAGIAFAVAGVWAGSALAHCDTLDGPVVAAAQRALQSGKVEHALVWVDKGDEQRVRAAFDKARAARASGVTADGPADMAFYATLVRVHREGEGEKFTGLKPAGAIEPAIALADEALATGTPAKLEKAIADDVVASVHKRYESARALRDFDPSNVEAGRRYVSAYVEYVHHVERVHDVASSAGQAHDAAPAHAAGARPRHAH
jgi:hypothetical protein